MEIGNCQADASLAHVRVSAAWKRPLETKLAEPGNQFANRYGKKSAQRLLYD